MSRRSHLSATARRTLLRTVVASAITVTIFWILARRLTFSNSSVDEDSFLWHGWSVDRGLVPFRDFHDYKAHMVFFSSALALKIFGLAGRRYRYFFTLLAGASILSLAISLSVRRVHVALTAALVFVICSLWLDAGYHDSSFVDAESLGMSYYLLGVSLFFIARTAPATQRFSWTNLFGGVLFCFSVLSKEPYLFVVIATWLCMLAWNYADLSSWGKARQFARSTLTGVGAVALSLLAYLLLTRSFMPYVRALRLEAMYSNSICAIFGVWTPSTFKQEWLVRFTKLSDNLVNYARLGIAVPLLLAPFVLVSRRRIIVTALALLAALGGLYAVTLGGCFFTHYYQMGMTGLFFLMAVGVQYINEASIGIRGGLRPYMAVSMMMLTGWALWPRVSAELGAVHQQGGPRESAALLDFVEKNTTPSDTIFTTGWHGIYVFTNRLPAIGECTYFDAFLSFYPGNTDEERLKPFYDQLVKNRPKIIIIEQAIAEKRVRHMTSLVLPFVRNFGYIEHHEPGIRETMYLRPN